MKPDMREKFHKGLMLYYSYSTLFILLRVRCYMFQGISNLGIPKKEKG